MDSVKPESAKPPWTKALTGQRTPKEESCSIGFSVLSSVRFAPAFPERTTMRHFQLRHLLAAVVLATSVLAGISCRVVATTGDFYGSTVPPKQNILRYVNGDEPESLDPPVSSGQPEARIYMALFEGLVEYDPKSLNAIPGIAESWTPNNDSSEFVFHLRHNARWSNGEPITAQDFVYTIRRGLSPELASKNAYLAYYITYAE